MNWIVVTYLVFYALIVGGVVLGGFLLHLKKSEANGAQDKISVDEITVLIPFRNERERLHVLLKSIQSLKQFPARFIFIDDHSTDDSSAYIREQLGDLPYEILTLSNEVTGKTKAIRAGIEQCTTDYVLTFDADVSFEANYFNAIQDLNQADMYVLPAILVGQTPLELIYELDVALANALNAGLSGVARPIFSSGANFLFKRSVFHEVDDLSSHAHMASGDDTYLLRDFRRNGKSIQLRTNLDVAVHTETPHSFKAFIDQRLRWVGKTTDLGDALATWAAIGQFLFAVLFFGLLVWFAAVEEWFHFSLLLVVKVLLDLLFFMPFFSRTKRVASWCLIPVYEIVFPLYSLLIGVLMLTYRPKWKGRAIQQGGEASDS